MSIDINRPFSYGSGISFQDSQGDSLYARGNQLNEQTPQGARIAVFGEPKLGQTALVVAKRGIIGIPNLGSQETHPSGSTAASPAKPQAIKSFAQLKPKFEQLLKDFEHRIDHGNDPQVLLLLKQELRSEFHSLLAIPPSRCANILLTYSDANGQPHRYDELDRVIFDGIAKVLRELENNPSEDMEVAREAGWLHQLLLKKNTVRFTTSLKSTQKLLRSIERLRSKLTESWVEVERVPSGITWYSKSKKWENSEIKDRLGDIQSGIATIIEWLTADDEGRNRMLQMPEAHRRGLNFFQSLTSKDVMQNLSPIFVSQLPEGMAATWRLGNGQMGINVSSNYLQSHSSDIVAGAIVHESGHLLEYQNPVILEKSIAFSSQIKTHDKDSGYKDFLYRDSQGKVIATEVLAVAVGRIYHDPVEFFREYPNWFGFVIDILRGVDISKQDNPGVIPKPDVFKQDNPELIRCFEVAS